MKTGDKEFFLSNLQTAQLGMPLTQGSAQVISTNRKCRKLANSVSFLFFPRFQGFPALVFKNDVYRFQRGIYLNIHLEFLFHESIICLRPKIKFLIMM